MPNKPKKKPTPINAEIWVGSKTQAEALALGFNATAAPVTVVTNEKAEDADCVVCAYAGEEREQFKADNIYTNCADCAKAITHRPHTPKKPVKVCMPCAVIRMKMEGGESCGAN